MPENQTRRPHVAKLLRLTLAEAAILTDAAEELGISETDLLRMLVRHAKFITVSVPPIRLREE